MSNIYQITDNEGLMFGLFNDLEHAKREAQALQSRYTVPIQVNEIPLNTVGRWSEDINCVFQAEPMGRVTMTLI